MTLDWIAHLLLCPLTETRLEHYIHSSRVELAHGCDSIMADILKLNFYFISKLLLHIMKLCINSGVFPDCFKLAKIFPLHKSNEISNMNNFRPISLLSIFPKVLEKRIKDQLVNYFPHNNILSGSQYGFHLDKNISDALFDKRIKSFNIQ